MRKNYVHPLVRFADFHSIVLRFRNLSDKIDALIRTGKFYEIAQKQQQSLIAKLRRLYEKLTAFNPGYAIKLASAAMCFTLISGTASALPAFRTFIDNPFSFSAINGQSGIGNLEGVTDGAFADIDGDGDDDAILMTICGPYFFENQNGHFVENCSANPFISIDSYGCSSYLTAWGAYGTGIDMADFDGDGDLDAIIIDGNSSGRLKHYELNSARKFYPNSGSHLNQAHSYSFFQSYRVKFADVDGDGDLDLVGAIYSGGGFILQSLFQQSNHQFSGGVYNYPVCGSIVDNPVWNVNFDFADLDGDGDEDLFVFSPTQPESPGVLTNATGNIFYFENTPGSGAFVANSNIPLPVGSMSPEYFPLLVDLDGDGDIDVFSPRDGGMSSFENTSAQAVPVSPFVALIAFAAAGFGIFRRNRRKKKES